METQNNNSGQTQNKNMVPCKSCGNMVSKNAKACPNCGAKIKKPIYKRVWFILLIIVAVIVIIAIATSGGGSSNSGEQPTNSGAVVADSGESNLGKSKVEIKSCSLSTDYEGSPVAVVTYSYTNNGTEAQAFDIAFITHAYQNGVEAEKAYVLSDENYEKNNNQSKEIKPGVTIDVMVAYKLNDTTSPVEVEVGQFLSFDNTKVTRTFNF